MSSHPLDVIFRLLFFSSTDTGTIAEYEIILMNTSDVIIKNIQISELFSFDVEHFDFKISTIPVILCNDCTTLKNITNIPNKNGFVLNENKSYLCPKSSCRIIIVHRFEKNSGDIKINNLSNSIIVTSYIDVENCNCNKSVKLDPISKISDAIDIII